MEMPLWCESSRNSFPGRVFILTVAKIILFRCAHKLIGAAGHDSATTFVPQVGFAASVESSRLAQNTTTGKHSLSGRQLRRREDSNLRGRKPHFLSKEAR